MQRKRREIWHKQFHVLSVDMFRVDVGLAVNMSQREVERAVRRLCKDDAIISPWVKELETWDSDGAHGRMTMLGGGFVVLIRANKNQFRDVIGTVVHEMVHVAQYLTRERRIPLQEATEEVHAYLIEYLTVEALRRLY